MKKIQIQEFEVEVDDEDADKILAHTWYVNRTMLRNKGMHYFIWDKVVEGKKVSTYLHRFIMGATQGNGLEVDHIDHNGLNLKKSNLRAVPHQHNMYNMKKVSTNTTGYKNVQWHKAAKKYTVVVQGTYYGLFTDLVEAAKVADKIMLGRYKEFALTNFDKSSYTDEEIQEALSKYLPVTKSKYKGVTGKEGSWIAYVAHGKQRYHVGVFFTEEDAARARDRKLISLCGKDARTNFPIEEYDGIDLSVEANIAPERHKQEPNKTGYIGVCSNTTLADGTKRWTAKVEVKGNKISVGTYNTALEAALARDAKAFELLGQKAKLNFPERVVDGVYNKEV